MISKRVIDSFESYFSAEITDEIKESMRCPRCGAQLECRESGAGCLGKRICYVVPPILILTCPQCGYTERSWA